MSNDIDAFFDSVDGGPVLARAPGDQGHGDLEEFFGEEATMGVPDAPADDLLHRINTFLTKHNKQLNDMRETLSDTVTEAWNEENYTVKINMEPQDNVPILSLVQTENAQFNKVTMVFSYLCEEIRTMKSIAEKKFYGPLTMFGHDFQPPPAAEGEDKNAGSAAATVQSNLPEKVAPEQEMGAFLPLLQDLTNFIKRLYSLARNLVNQLACLYHERQKLWMSTFKFINLDLPFQCLAELATITITLDAIVLDNPNFHTYWQQFKRMIKYVRADPAKYGMDNIAKLRVFETMLLNLDRLILSGNMFANLLELDFGLANATSTASTMNNSQQQPQAPTLVSGNKVLYETFTIVIRLWFKRLTHGIGETIETYPRHQIVDCYALYALQRGLFRHTIKPDKNVFTELWMLQKKVPIVHLFGRACWFIADFLGKYAPVDLRNLTPSGKGILTMRMETLQAADEVFVQRTEELYNQLSVWMVRMDSELAPSASHNISTVLNARSKLILNGILLANQIRNLLVTNLFSHLNVRESFRAKNIRSYSICCEMLKSIQMTYNKRASMISENLSHMIGQTAFTIKKILIPIKKKLEKFKKLDDAKLDILAAITLALSVLDQPPTSQRLLLLTFASSVAQFDGLLKEHHLDEFKYQLWKLELLATHQRIVDRYTDCSFIYWISNLVPAIFADIFNLSSDPNQVQRLQYLFLCFKDCGLTLFNTDVSVHTAGMVSRDRQIALQTEYANEILSHFNVNIMNPLCREVETDLRLHIHSVVLQQANLRNTQRIKDLSKFLNLKPLKFFDTLIDVKGRVTHYLDSIFYNLNTVALHDWRIYAEMRNLAHEKYGLDMTEVHLPGTAHYSEALDILEIMRHIHIFVSRYNYNMNTQVFIERAFDQKHVNCINIYHISDSLRTHGTGISNTTVNFTYQFLIRKFKIFSEFLFDDHIKSRLIKQIRYFKQEREKLNNRYPYEMADKFLKDIRKLGVADDGTTFLDQFRKQITEIGNALGYVRMVRSGGLHHVSASIKFVPDLEAIPSFQETASKEGLSEETKNAAKNLDAVLQDLSQNFSEGSEYFQVLVKVFQPVLNNEAQTHLKNFYAIVPPLTLNFVEKMQLQKEKLPKATGRAESSFTDDGFALGLAYILKILDQNDAFNSLHWFESVNNHIGTRRNEGNTLRANIQQQKSSGKLKDAKAAEEDLQQHQVNMKKLTNVQTEFDLFFYSFSGATIFFQDTTSPPGATGVDGQAKEEQKTGETGASPSPDAAAAANGASPPPAPAMDIPVPPPLDNGAFVVSAGAPPPPPMLAAADGMVVGAGAPPPPPPPDF